MKSASLSLIRGLAVAVLLSALQPWKSEAAPSQPVAVSPVGETKPFHGTLRAKDTRLGTLSLGSSKKITRILALDPASRLNKGIYPATLADFSIGDVVEGFAFPDPLGRMVVAVATASAPPLNPSEVKGKKASKPHKPRASGAKRSRTGASAAPRATTARPPAQTPSATPKSPATKPKSKPAAAKPMRPRTATLHASK